MACAAAREGKFVGRNHQPGLGFAFDSKRSICVYIYHRVQTCSASCFFLLLMFFMFRGAAGGNVFDFVPFLVVLETTSPS